MGVPKGLLDYHGKEWIIEQIERFKGTGGERVIIVLGFDSVSYLNQLPWIADSLNQRITYNGVQVTTLLNPHPKNGPFSSLQRALASVHSSNTPGVFVLPVDVPAPMVEVWHKLVDHLNGKVKVVIPEYKAEGGHPILLSSGLVNELRQISLTDETARLDMQIRKLPAQQVTRISTQDVQVTMNLNTPEEWDSFKKKVVYSFSRFNRKTLWQDTHVPR